jgi:hypothetical protein
MNTGSLLNNGKYIRKLYLYAEFSGMTVKIHRLSFVYDNGSVISIS